MAHVSFYEGLGNHVLKWASRVPGSATQYGGSIRLNEPGFKTESDGHHRVLIEQLLLFDQVHMNISGPNTIAPLLYNAMGAKAFDRLLDQQALTFVIWQPVPYIGTNSGQVGSAFVGRIGDGNGCEIDPERIVDYGLLLCENNMSSSYKSGLRRKLIKNHVLLDEEIANTSWEMSLKALRSGIYEESGFSSDFEIIGASKDRGEVLLEATQSLLRYRYLLSKGYTAFEDDSVYNFLRIGIENVKATSPVLRNFTVMAKYERFPNLRSLYSEVENPYERIGRFRDTHDARKFRSWISCIGQLETEDIIREYIDACAGRKGLFESNPAKFLKIVSLVGIGHCISSAFGATLSSVLQPIVDNAIEIGVDLCLSVADTFIVDNVKTGWTPRAYFSGLQRMREK